MKTQNQELRNLITKTMSKVRTKMQVLFVLMLTLRVNSSFGQVMVYSDCDYQGNSITLTEGKYDFNQLGIPNDAISSIKITDNNYSVILYEDGGFGGKTLMLDASIACLTSKTLDGQINWNDQVSGVKIIKKSNKKITDFNKTDKPKGNSGFIPLTVKFNPSFDFTIDGVKGKTTLYMGGNPVQPKSEIKTKPGSEKTTKDYNKGWLCTTKTIKVDINSDEFLTNGIGEQLQYIYPGAVYTYKSYFGGAYKPENSNRNPITLSISERNLNGSPNVIVNTPNKENIREGITTLWNRINGNVQTNYTTKYKTYEVHKTTDLNLAITGGGYGFGFKVNNEFKMKNSSDYKYFLVDVTKEYFTIDCSYPTNGIFNNEQQNNNNELMYMNSVSYGIRILAMIETKIVNSEMSNKLAASYSAGTWGGNINLDLLLKEMSEETTVRMYAVGGASKELGLINSKEAFDAAVNGFLKNSINLQAQPIRFTFKNMKDERVTASTATDYYTVQECVPDIDQSIYNVELNLFMVQKGGGVNNYGEVGIECFTKMGYGYLPVVTDNGAYKDYMYCRDGHNRSNQQEKINSSAKYTFTLKQINDGAFIRLYYRISGMLYATEQHLGLQNLIAQLGNHEKVQYSTPKPSGTMINTGHFSACNGDLGPDIYDYIDIKIADYLDKVSQGFVSIEHNCQQKDELVTFQYQFHIKPKN